MNTADPNHMLKKFLVGGAALGAGAASTAALVNWLKSLGQEASEETKQDDDVVYVNVPRPGGMKTASLLKPGLAVTGGVLAAGAGYMTVRKLVQMIKERDAQQRLDKAQQVYVGSVEDEAQAKGAGRAPSWGEGSYAAATAIPLLLALASGALTYNALDKNFPAARPTKDRSLRPRKIVLRYPDQPAQEELSPEESDEMKQASFELTQDDIDDAHAFVLRTAHQLIKVARADSDLDDLIGAVQNGRSQELNLLVDHGLTPDTIFDAVKGASYPIEPGKSAVAYSLLAKSARLGPLAMGLAQAEILELAQHHALAGYKAAADPEAGVYKTSCLAKIFSEFERGARLEEARDYFFSKDAALIDEAVQAEQDTPPLTEEQLLALLMQQQQQPQQLLAPAQENPELNEDGPGGQDIATEEALTPTMV